MTCAHGFQLKAQQLLVDTAPGKANLCHTAAKTDHYKHELKNKYLNMRNNRFY